MSRYLIIYIVLLISLYYLRYSENIRVQKNVFSGTIQWRVVNLPVKTRSKYIINWKGLRLECVREEGDCKKLESVQIGDTVHIFSRSPEEAIDLKNTNIVPIHQSKITVYKAKALPGLSPWWWMRNIVAFKDYTVHLYETLLAEPHASLLAGIVLGEDRSLPQQFYDDLIETGTLHIVAASGFNVTIVAGILIAILLRIFSRRVAIVAGMVGVGGYAVLAGMSPAVVRAAIMAVVALITQSFGRQYLAEFSLVLSAGIMMILSPWILSSISFQLSIAATAGLLWGVQPIQNMLENALKTLHAYPWKLPLIGEILLLDLSTTLAASLATAPITLVQFGQFSWISPLVNMLILWAVPPLMIFGMILIPLHILWQPLATLMSWLVWPLLEYLVLTVSLVPKYVPGLVEVTRVNWWLAGGWWLLLFAWWKSKNTEGMR